MHKISYYCVRCTHELFIQLRVYNISVVQCMQFTSSYDKECYNEHDVMYHYFWMIAQNMLISYNIHTWCLHTTYNLWYFNIYYLSPLPNIKNVWYFSLFLFSFFSKQYSTNTFTPLQLPPPNISNVCSKTAGIIVFTAMFYATYVIYSNHIF